MKFMKLKMIWNIIRGRCVVYNTTITPTGLIIKNDKSIINQCHFYEVGTNGKIPDACQNSKQ